jgi:integrase
MAVVERKDSKGIVFYAVNEWNGRQKSERVGRNRRDAKRRDEAMKKEIADGTYQPPKERKSLEVGDVVTMFNGKRGNKAASTKANELALAKNHLEPRSWLWSMPARDLRPFHCDKLIAELREVTKPDGSRQLSDRSIMDVIGVLRRSFASAVRAELCDRQPVLIEPGTWNHVGKTREPYTAAETVVLTHHHQIPQHVRVLAALWLLAGLRQGEGCGLKWKRLDLETRPLACLTIAEQWRGEALKTKRPRVVPVHPVLLHILREWAETGFEAYTGRKPTPDDYVVPELDGFGVWGCYGSHTSYWAFVKACEVAGVRYRTLHSCRHTFVTLCRRGGARADVLERVSHNAAGAMIDRYTHFDWEPLCEAVLCLRLERLPDAPPLTGNGGESGGSGSSEIVGNSRENPLLAGSQPASSTGRHLTPGGQTSLISDSGAAVQAAIQGAGGEPVGSDDPEEAFRVALGEGLGAAPAGVRPPVKTRPVGYVARKRVSR